MPLTVYEKVAWVASLNVRRPEPTVEWVTSVESKVSALYGGPLVKSMAPAKLPSLCCCSAAVNQTGLPTAS